MPTRAGPMRQVIRIEERTSVQDENGEEKFSWNLVAQRRAELVAFPGSEIWSSKERSARVPTIFRMRFPKTIKVMPQMRVVYKGRVFDIGSAVDEDGRETNLLLTCNELIGEPV